MPHTRRPKPRPEQPDKALQIDAERVLSELGDRLRTVLERFNHGSATTRDLEHDLGLHKTLCWRILQVANAREPLAAAQHVPGDEGLEKFLRAAGRAGVDRPTLDAVREAAERYRALMKLHAGDRASFEVMLLSLAEPGDSAVELKAARRAGYRSTSYAWGAQTAVRILSVIITPSGTDAVDLATIRGHVRARRIRDEGAIRLSRTVEHDTDEPGQRRSVAEPIEPENLVGGVPLLRDFCTNPLPPLEAVQLPGMNVEYRFTTQPIGELAAITTFTGEVRRGLKGARWQTEGNTSNALMMTIRDPVGLGVIDLWAPPEFGFEHRALLIAAIGVDPLSQKPTQWHILPASVKVERMGRGLHAARITEAPTYENALARCFQRLAWDPATYELHRIQLEYPVLGSCMVLQTQLPPAAI